MPDYNAIVKRLNKGRALQRTIRFGHKGLHLETLAHVHRGMHRIKHLFAEAQELRTPYKKPNSSEKLFEFILGCQIRPASCDVGIYPVAESSSSSGQGSPPRPQPSLMQAKC
jgi:hypothetical protein